MAPYVFTVKIANDLHSGVPLQSPTRHNTSGLDGYTSFKFLSDLTKPDGQAEITKGGGTDGLFTLLSFWAGLSESDIKLKFEVYCEMGASSGSSPRCLLGNCNGVSWEDFKDGDRANKYCARGEGEEIVERRKVGFVEKAVKIVNQLGVPIPYTAKSDVKYRISIGQSLVHEGIKVELTDPNFGYPRSGITLKITKST